MATGREIGRGFRLIEERAEPIARHEARFCRPIVDETLESWQARWQAKRSCRATGRDEMLRALRSEGVENPQSWLEWWDNYPRNHWQWRHSGGAHCVGYCPDCWEDDVANGRWPYWRITWTSPVTILCSSHRRLLVDYEHFDSPAWVEYQNHVGHSVEQWRQLTRVLRLELPDPIKEARRIEGAPWYAGRFDNRWVRYASQAGQWIEQCTAKGRVSIAKQTYVTDRAGIIRFFGDVLSALLPVFPVWSLSPRNRGAAPEFIWRISPLRRLRARPVRQHDLDPPWPETESAEALTFPAQPVDFRAAALLLMRALCDETSVPSEYALHADAQIGWKEYFLDRTPVDALERLHAAASQWPPALRSVLRCWEDQVIERTRWGKDKLSAIRNAKENLL